MPSTTSSGRSCRCWLIWWMLLRTFRCESTTPFGSPVEPEVKITVAVASRWSSLQAGQERPERGDRDELGDRRADQLVGLADLRRDVFQEDQRPLGRDLELVEHLLRGQDVRDPALVDRRIDQRLAGRVVQVDRDLAEQRQGEVGDGRRDRRRDQQADVRLGPEQPLQDPAEDDGAEERVAVGEATPWCCRPAPGGSPAPAPGGRRRGAATASGRAAAAAGSRARRPPSRRAAGRSRGLMDGSSFGGLATVTGCRGVGVTARALTLRDPPASHNVTPGALIRTGRPANSPRRTGNAASHRLACHATPAFRARLPARLRRRNGDGSVRFRASKSISADGRVSALRTARICSRA